MNKYYIKGAGMATVGIIGAGIGIGVLFGVKKNKIIKRNYPGDLNNFVSGVKVIFFTSSVLMKGKKRAEIEESYEKGYKIVKEDGKYGIDNGEILYEMNEKIKKVSKDRSNIDYKLKTSEEFHIEKNEKNYNNLEQKNKEFLEENYKNEYLVHSQVNETTEKGFEDMAKVDFNSEEPIIRVNNTSVSNYKTYDINNKKEYNLDRVENSFNLKGTNMHIKGNSNGKYESNLCDMVATKVGDYLKEEAGLLRKVLNEERVNIMYGKNNIEEIKEKGLENFMEDNGKSLELYGSLRENKFLEKLD